MTTFPFPGPDLVFGASSILAMLGWTALALSPARARWAGAACLFAGRVVPLLLAVVYAVLFARNGMADGGNGSLPFGTLRAFVHRWRRYRGGVVAAAA